MKTITYLSLTLLFSVFGVNAVSSQTFYGDLPFSKKESKKEEKSEENEVEQQVEGSVIEYPTIEGGEAEIEQVEGSVVEYPTIEEGEAEVEQVKGSVVEYPTIEEGEAEVEQVKGSVVEYPTIEEGEAEVEQQVEGSVIEYPTIEEGEAKVEQVKGSVVEYPTVEEGATEVEQVKESVVKESAIEYPVVEESLEEEKPTEVISTVQETIEEEVSESKESIQEKEEVIEEKEVVIFEDDVVDTSIAPSKTFDLSNWNLSVPTDEDGNKRADQISVSKLNAGYSNELFYTAPDGGMVFKCTVGGFKTSANTTYTRTELREMLRGEDKTISTKGPSKNNWVLKSSASIYDAGGYDGQLKATLKVDRVTTTGKPGQVGRVVIGQIHAEHNEPLRLYYRKLPNNDKGSIYFAHEGRDNGKEDFYELIGSKSNDAKNPENGIALGEKFSYQVLVLDNSLAVKIIREDKTMEEKIIDIRKSGYDAKGEYMYFKAGVYNQNKTGEPGDYVKATFYKLSSKHKKYVEKTYDD